MYIELGLRNVLDNSVNIYIDISSNLQTWCLSDTCSDSLFKSFKRNCHFINMDDTMKINNLTFPFTLYLQKEHRLWGRFLPHVTARKVD